MSTEQVPVGRAAGLGGSRRRRRASMKVKQWWVLVYRVPSEPASKRVGLWRDLKRMGALYLQQCVCILPDIGDNGEELERVMAKIPALGGEAIRFVVPRLEAADEARIIAGFREQRASEYAEIVEECETKFQKEIEFEHFRENYTFQEAEEIEQDLDKIRRWYDRVKARDWFHADRADEVDGWLERCQQLLNGFVEEVYRRQERASLSRAEEDDEAADVLVAEARLMPLPLRRRKRAARATDGGA
jgi:hypothetical protein